MARKKASLDPRAIAQEVCKLSVLADKTVEDAFTRPPPKLTRPRACAYCCLLIAAQHARSLTCLAAEGNLYTAQALIRPIRETLIKHQWFLQVASVDEIEAFLGGNLKVDNGKTLATLKTKDPEVAEALSQDEKLRGVFNSYVHSGNELINQVAHYFLGGQLKSFAALHERTLFLIGIVEVRQIVVYQARLLEDHEAEQLLLPLGNELMKKIQRVAESMSIPMNFSQ